MSSRREGSAQRLVCAPLQVGEVAASNYSFADPVMAEYITIMIINNKTAGASNTMLAGNYCSRSLTIAQITSELEDRAYNNNFPLNY
jgi:hypothetical protein